MEGAKSIALQIGSTPKFSRCSSMKAVISLAFAGRACARERASRLEDLVGSAKLLVLAFELLQALLFIGAETRLESPVPSRPWRTQSLSVSRGHVGLGGYRSDAGPLRRVRALISWGYLLNFDTDSILSKE